MNENKNNTAAAAEEAVDSIRKLLDAVGNDEELKQKLEDALAALTGKRSETAETNETSGEKEESSAAVAEEDSADEDDDGEISSGSDLSDVFSEDALAGMVVGFVAGAALVGGGVLIHKLICK